MDLSQKASQRIRERAFWVEEITHAKYLKKECVWYVLKTERRSTNLAIKMSIVIRTPTKRPGLN